MTVGSAEDGIPMPPKPNGRPRGGLADRFRQLEVGQSFIVTGRSLSDGIAGYYKHLRRPDGSRMMFSARTTSEGVRVWRVA